ncbi:hypothetical protein BC943DRAFT_324228 [Umbelopsis sp. AD052]|nr:hypothetical protein BC943DRAFT_324228 [Umbelopsis sp. AD052]
MTTPLSITVPEAASSVDTIQFKIVLGEEDSAEYLQNHNLASGVCFRSFQQIAWLHEQLLASFPDLLVPPFPDPPLSSQIEDQDIVERKRIQIGRFLEKLGMRQEFNESSSFVHFLSHDMTETEIGNRNKNALLAFLRFNKAKRPNTELAFKQFKTNETVQDSNMDAHHQQQVHILMQETFLSNLLDNMEDTIREREALSNYMTHMGDLAIEATQSKNMLGPGVKYDNKERQRSLDQRLQIFGLLMDELCFINNRQEISDLVHFGDVIAEYKNTTDPLKAVVNIRTDRLMEYVQAIKLRNKKRDKADKLRVKMPQHTQEVQVAIQEEEKAKEDVQVHRVAYLKADSIVNREISLFEEYMSTDLNSSIKAYVASNIAQERRKLHSMEKAFQKIKDGYARKCSLTDLEGDDEQAENDQEEEGRRRRMQYRQQQDASTTLRTSSSLPSLNKGGKSRRSMYAEDPIEEEDYGSTTRTGSFDERTSVWTMNVPGRTGRTMVPFEGQAL